MTKIAATVVLYNPDEETINNIKSYIDDVDKVYVIDNSKTDNSKMLFKSKKIEYYPNMDNLGVSVALNKAAKKAIKDGYKWLLTMDQDSCFEEDNLKKMIKYIDDNKTIWNEIGLLSPWHEIKTGVEKSKKKIEDVVEVMTSGNIINLDAYQKIGGYKDWLFIDGIDFDFCMNLNVHGYKVRRLNYCSLKHELGDIKIVNILGRKFVCSNHSAVRRYYMCRNNHYIYDMYHEHFPDYCDTIIRGLEGQFKNILVFEKDKYKKIRNMRRGYQDYKKGIKGKYNYKN